MLLILKIGGNVIDNEAALTSFLADFAQLPSPKILVHGGGKLATELSKKLDIQPLMIEGRRITDAETLKVVTMVYAGLVNKTIVAKLQALGCNALGLSGADADCLRASKRVAGEVDYGFVGDIAPENIRIDFFSKLLDSDYTPIASPITHDGQGQLLNTNADTIAASLAKALSRHYAVKLVYCFEKPGVLANAADDSSVITKITAASYTELKASGVVSGGMIPKLDNAFDALNAGVESVVIGDAKQVKELILADNQVGTLVKIM